MDKQALIDRAIAIFREESKGLGFIGKMDTATQVAIRVVSDITNPDDEYDMSLIDEIDAELTKLYQKP